MKRICRILLFPLYWIALKLNVYIEIIISVSIVQMLANFTPQRVQDYFHPIFGKQQTEIVVLLYQIHGVIRTRLRT